MIGAASAVCTLLEVAIGIVSRLQRAYKQAKELKEVLQGCNYELCDTKSIVQAVRDEEALKSTGVAHQLDRIEAVVKKLLRLLGALDPGCKGPLRQLAHQLVQGSKEQKTLTELMAELTRAKTNLGLRMQVANIGLTRSVEGSSIENSAVLHHVNEVLQVALGEGQGLKSPARSRHRAEKGTKYPPVF